MRAYRRNSEAKASLSPSQMRVIKASSEPTAVVGLPGEGIPVSPFSLENRRLGSRTVTGRLMSDSSRPLPDPRAHSSASISCDNLFRVHNHVYIPRSSCLFKENTVHRV